MPSWRCFNELFYLRYGPPLHSNPLGVAPLLSTKTASRSCYPTRAPVSTSSGYRSPSTCRHSASTWNSTIYTPYHRDELGSQAQPLG